MPVYSFHKGGGHAFIKSPAAARNRITSPTGTGQLGYIGVSLGFITTDTLDPNIWDFSKWYPICVFKCEWTRLGVTKVNQYRISFPKYYNDPNLPWEGTIEIQKSEFTEADRYLDRTELKSQYNYTDKIITEWRTSANSDDGPVGTLRYSETYTWYEVPTNPVRTWPRIVNAVNSGVESGTSFGQSWYLTDSGRAIVRSGLTPPNVYSQVSTTVSVPALFPALILPSQILGIKPFCTMSVSRVKYRYRSKLSATNVLTRQQFGGVFGSAGSPIVLLSESSLPNGIDVAVPPAVSVFAWLEYPHTNTARDQDFWRIRYRRAVVPPDTRPPGV